MRKSSQIAELILGSGLVGNASKEQTPLSRPSSASQGPALYQFRSSRSGRRPSTSYRFSEPENFDSFLHPNKHQIPDEPQQQPHYEHHGLAQEIIQQPQSQGYAISTACQQDNDTRAHQAWQQDEVPIQSAIPTGKQKDQKDQVQIQSFKSSGRHTPSQALRSRLSAPVLTDTHSQQAAESVSTQPAQEGQLAATTATDDEDYVKVIESLKQALCQAETREQGLSKELQTVKAQLAAAQEAAGQAQKEAASSREAASKCVQEREQAAQKAFRATKQAEAAKEQAEAAKRIAERKAAAAEAEVQQLKAAAAQQEDAHRKVVSELQAMLDNARQASGQQISTLQAAVGTSKNELQALQRAKAAELDSERKQWQETLESLRQEVARRTQTILTLNADCETHQKDKSQLQATISELQSQVQLLQQKRVTETTDTQRRASVTFSEFCVEREIGGIDQQKPLFSNGQHTDTPSRLSIVGTESVYSHATMGPSPSQSNFDGQPLMAHADTPDPKRSSKTNVTATEYMPNGYIKLEVQAQLAQIREQYAQRLISMEAAVKQAETAAKETVTNCEQLLQAIVDRTALLLSGRLHLDSSLLFHLCGGACDSANISDMQPRPNAPARRPHAITTTAVGQERISLLSSMNDRLSVENAQLLAELGRFHSGKHRLLRRDSMSVAGAADNDNLQPPASTNNQQQNAPTVSLNRSLSMSSNATAMQASVNQVANNASYARLQHMSSHNSLTPPRSRSSNGSLSEERAPTTASVVSAAKTALAVATKEVLICCKKQSLSAVMTNQAWDSSHDGKLASNSSVYSIIRQHQLKSKAETAIETSEQLFQSQAAAMHLQKEVISLQAQLFAANNELVGFREAATNAKAGSSQVAAELEASQRRVSELEDMLRSARYSIPSRNSSTCGTEAGGDAGRDVESRLRTAKDEIQRHRNTAAAASREKCQLEDKLSEQLSVSKQLELQLREEKAERRSQDESMKRVRALLMQARGLLKDANIPFMEEDTQPIERRGSRQGSTTGEPETPFSAVDAREREKDYQRLQAEVMTWQQKAAAASKEIKTLRAQASRKEAEWKQAMAALTTSCEQDKDMLRQEAAVAKSARETAERTVRTAVLELDCAQSKCRELEMQLEKQRVHAEYLKQRATQLKQLKPRLSYASTLSLSIAAEQDTP